MSRAALALLAALLLAASPAAGAAPPRKAERAPARARVAADTGAARPRVAPRTLDDIHIEGEIPVPQVLFITARDQRRFVEFQHHRYQRTSLELGRATPSPSRLVVTDPKPVQRKESPR
jgi:hypothetical protein